MLDVNDEIRSIYNKYFEELKICATKRFNKVVLPYLKKYHLDFHSTQGASGIRYTDKTPEWFIKKYAQKKQVEYICHLKSLDRSLLPKVLVNTIDAAIPSSEDEFLCDYMPSYKD